MCRLLLCAFFALCLAGRAHAQDGGPPEQDADVGESQALGVTTDAGLLDGSAREPPAEAAAATPAEVPATQPAEAAAAEPADIASPASDVVVTASRPSSKDRTQDRTLIDGERVRTSARSTVFEVLSQEAADVYVPGRGVGLHGVASGATGGIRIRGLGGSPNTQILVVEDDVPDYQGIFGHPIPDAYVPHLIDEVLVVKGGDSTLYGTNAMGGVVVIRSRWLESEEDGYAVAGDLAAGSYATLRESVSLLGRTGAWDVAAAFTGMKTDGHRQGAGGGDMVGTAALRYRWTPNLRLTLRNKVVHVQGGDPGPVQSPTTDHGFDVWRNTTSMQVAYTRGKARLSLVPYLNLGIHRLYDGFYSRDYVGGATGELKLPLDRAANLLLGVAGEGVGGSVANRITGERPSVRSLGDASVYGQMTLQPFASLGIVLGARGLASSRYGFVPLYKAGARWDLGRGFFFHGRISRNFRRPTMRELYLPYPTANPDLKPEYAQNANAGLGYSSGQVEITCTGYRTEARDLIKYFGVWPAAEVVNIDHIVVHGVEGRVAVRNVGPLSASLSAARQGVGRYTRQNPDAKINFSIDFAQAFAAGFLGANLTGEWVHGLFMADYGRQPIPDVFVMDLAVRYRHTSRQRGMTLEPYLLLRNFLDRSYAYVAGYTMPGFNILLGLKLEI